MRTTPADSVRSTSALSLTHLPLDTLTTRAGSTRRCPSANCADAPHQPSRAGSGWRARLLGADSRCFYLLAESRKVIARRAEAKVNPARRQAPKAIGWMENRGTVRYAH